MKSSDTTSHEINYYSDMGMYEFSATAELIHAERQESAPSITQAEPQEKLPAQVPLKRLYAQSEKPLKPCWRFSREAGRTEKSESLITSWGREECQIKQIYVPGDAESFPYGRMLP